MNEIIIEQQAEIEALRYELAQCKANHQDMVERNAVLRGRHDLPVDRLPAHRRLIELQEENRQLKELISNSTFLSK